MPKPEGKHGAERLIEECKQATSQESLVLDASQDLGLDLKDSDAAAVCKAIKNNRRVRTLRFSKRVTVSPSAAYQVVEGTFIPHPTLEELEFKPYGNVNTPSQKHLMRMLDEFPESVESHNAHIESDERRYRSFERGVGNEAKRARTSSSSSSSSSNDAPKTPPVLPSDMLEEVLKPFVVSGSPKKRLNLGE